MKELQMIADCMLLSLQNKKDKKELEDIIKKILDLVKKEDFFMAIMPMERIRINPEDILEKQFLELFKKEVYGVTIENIQIKIDSILKFIIPKLPNFSKLNNKAYIFNGIQYMAYLPKNLDETKKMSVKLLKSENKNNLAFASMLDRAIMMQEIVNEYQEKINLL